MYGKLGSGWLYFPIEACTYFLLAVMPLDQELYVIQRSMEQARKTQRGERVQRKKVKERKQNGQIPHTLEQGKIAEHRISWNMRASFRLCNFGRGIYHHCILKG